MTGIRTVNRGEPYVLNEVLSLNAQESLRPLVSPYLAVLLNEVLSLNAQESSALRVLPSAGASSMKS